LSERQDDDTTKTTAKTLWSETILEILYESLKANKSDAQIGEILREVQSKGFKRDYLVERVEKKVGDRAAIRVKALLAKK